MKITSDTISKTINIDKNFPDLNLIKIAGDALKQGRLIILPTETVYGLACNSNVLDSLNKIYQIKKRPLDKPFSFHFGDVDDFLFFAGYGLDARQKEIFLRLKDESITFVYFDSIRKKKLGVRFPSNKVGKMILKYSACPVIATSVNFSGESACISIDCMNNEILKKVDLIVDSGVCDKSIESTVIDISGCELKVLREGAFKL